MAKARLLPASTEGECMGGEEEKPQDGALKPIGGWRKNEQRRPRKSMVGVQENHITSSRRLPSSLDLRSLSPTP